VPFSADYGLRLRQAAYASQSRAESARVPCAHAFFFFAFGAIPFIYF
jgi:hypothetical protein